MLRSLTTRFSILACAMLVLPCVASTQGRGVAELEAWLGRLVGNFTVQVQGNTPAQGTAECRGVGATAGVSCLFNIVGSNGQRAPAMPQLMLFGVDAVDHTIQLLQLDFGEPAISARGSLRGDTVVFTSECSDRAFDSVPTVACDRSATVLAAATGQPMEISLQWDAAVRASAAGPGYADTRLWLHRVPL